jgi:hypothetical protein
MKTLDLPDIEHIVSRLATELTPRQRYLCAILIFQNPVVPDFLRKVLIRALDVCEAPRLEDPVCQAVLAFEYGKQLDPSDLRTRSAFTVLRSLGVMPDIFIAIKFMQALNGRLN